jgi:hypothetical protein
MTNGEKREAVLSLYGKLLSLQIEENSLNKEKAAVKEQLAKLIPQNGSFAGVRHTVVESKRTSWKEVAEAAREVLIPRTRWGDYVNLVEGNTKVSVYPRFSAEEA